MYVVAIFNDDDYVPMHVTGVEAAWETYRSLCVAASMADDMDDVHVTLVDASTGELLETSDDD